MSVIAKIEDQEALRNLDAIVAEGYDAGVRLTEAIERYGVDAFRYYLLRDVPYDGDGSFSTGTTPM